jgi:hypothetical protein
MRRLTAGVLALFLLGIGAGPALAQSPSPSAEAPGQRFVVPEAGLALTLPEDWEVLVRVLETNVGGHMDDPDRSLWRVLQSWTPHRHPDPERGGCDVLLFRTNDQDADSITLDDIWSNPYIYWSDPRYEATRIATDVMLPAGAATRFDFGDPDKYGDWHRADYRFTAPDGVVWLLCKSVGARPDDDWLSIAETFEFLPAEE